MLCWVLLTLLVMLPAVSVAATDTDHALHEAERRSGQMLIHSNDVMEQAEMLSRSSAFIDEVRNEAARALQRAAQLPPSDLPKLPQLTDAQHQRARDDIARLLDKVQGGNSQSSPGAKQGPQLYVFVSFSMPEAALQNLLRQAEQIEASLILRGLVDDDLGKTKTKIAQLLQADEFGTTTIQGGLAIDPTLFQRFDIRRVPAYVLTAEPVGRCTDAGCEAAAHVRLNGDATLQYVLETMAREAPAMRTSAEQLLSRMTQATAQ